MPKSKETYGKKEKEKKRLKQLQNKKQRMEERKANKKTGLTLEDMFMYPDENGHLQTKPPDPKFRKVVNADSIEIGVPKRENIPDIPRTGVVAFFNREKGFGFINDLVSQERIFFHINGLLEEIDESDKVTFFVEQGPKGLNASEVRKLN